MNFQNWILQESNLQDLYVNTVKAFPKTTKRHNAIDALTITELKTIPFLGMKTLLINALVKNEENNKYYKSLILFKNIEFKPNERQKSIEIKSENENFSIKTINIRDNEVLLRCNCPDFKWRFNYLDHKDNCLYGKVRKKYEAKSNPGSSNPLELSGMCKHLIKLSYTINEIGILGG